ncbi:hypothetical protein K438DRAFT_1779402 [Mycena galopus ATCC 62051]|nr:hypothetical protein K438DRAFT_1779402 [Mycena galopus ATCC 62051]
MIFIGVYQKFPVLVMCCLQTGVTTEPYRWRSFTIMMLSLRRLTPICRDGIRVVLWKIDHRELEVESKHLIQPDFDLWLRRIIVWPSLALFTLRSFSVHDRILVDALLFRPSTNDEQDFGRVHPSSQIITLGDASVNLLRSSRAPPQQQRNNFGGYEEGLVNGGRVHVNVKGRKTQVRDYARGVDVLQAVRRRIMRTYSPRTDSSAHPIVDELEDERTQHIVIDNNIVSARRDLRAYAAR